MPCAKATLEPGRGARPALPGIVDGSAAGRIAADPVIARSLTRAEINHGFDLMHRGGSIRAVVVD